MRVFRLIAVIVMIAMFVAGSANSSAQQNESADTAKAGEKAAPSGDKAAKPGDAEKEKAPKEEPPVVTHHEIHVGGRILRYTATTGFMPIRNEESGEVEAHIFFMAYTLDGAAPKRPLMFSFNGGPGIGLDLASPRRHRSAPREDAARRRDASATVSTGR